MALRLSTGLRNHLLANGSLRNALQGGILEIYSGSQPTTADAAVVGTLLATISNASGAVTSEVLASGTITLTGGASGSIDTVTVNGINIIPSGAVPFNTSLSQTASDLATAINADQSSPEYRASASGAVVTITAMPGTGTGPNTFVVAATLTTIAASYTNMAGGVANVNGLRFAASSAGAITKAAAQIWSGIGATTGTAGWFRFKAAVVDGGGIDSAATFIRMDGAVATSGAELNMSSTAIAAAAVQTISAFAITQPAA